MYLSGDNGETGRRRSVVKVPFQPTVTWRIRAREGEAPRVPVPCIRKEESPPRRRGFDFWPEMFEAEPSGAARG